MRIVVLLIIASVLFALLAYPLYMNLVPIQSDLGRYHLPVRDFYQRCLQQGDDPHWCPQLFCGFDLHGEGQGGFEHPWHRLLYSFLPLVPAFNLEVFANYPLILMGMFLFLRRHQMSVEASLAGAMWFTFSGYTIPHYCHTNAIAIIAHIPWLLWATDIQFTSTSIRQRSAATAFIAVLTGSQLLLGYPQYVIFSGIAESLYVVMLIYRDRRWSSLIWWVAAKTIGIAIGAAQLLPTLQALQLSPRMGYDKHFRGTGSLPPKMFLQFLAPTMFNEFMQMNEYTVYAGMLATFAGLWWLSHGSWHNITVGKLLNTDIKRLPSLFSKTNRTNNPFGGWTFWLALVAIVFALGRYTPLYTLYLKIPVVGLFRFPCRYLMLFHLAAAIAVAKFYDRLRQSTHNEGGSKYWGMALLLPVMTTLVCLNVSNIASPHYAGVTFSNFVNEGQAFWSIFLGLGMALVIIGAKEDLLGALFAVMLLGFADLAYYNFRTLDLPPLHKIGLPVTNTYQFADFATYQEREIKPPNTERDRVDVPDAGGNSLVILGEQLTRGYVGLSPPKILENQTIVQKLAGAKYQFDGFQWTTVDGLPLARLVNDIKVSSDPNKDIETINILTTALVDQSVEFEPGATGTAAISEERPGHIVVAANAPSKQLLVLAQSFHPNWRAMVDKVPTPIVRVNGDFQGVVVSAGGHRVVFTFETSQRQLGRWLSLAGLATAGSIYLLGWLVDTFQRRRVR